MYMYYIICEIKHRWSISILTKLLAYIEMKITPTYYIHSDKLKMHQFMHSTS